MRHDVQHLAIVSCILEQANWLNMNRIPLFSHVRLFYAQLLHQWGLECEQAEMMKFVHLSSLTQQNNNNNSDTSSDNISVVHGNTSSSSNNTLTPPDNSNIEGISPRSSSNNNNSNNNNNNENKCVEMQLGIMVKYSPRQKLSGPSKCSICHLPVRGLTMICVKCGHGGHVVHLKQWFSKHSVCATGCKCKCIEYFSPGAAWNYLAAQQQQQQQQAQQQQVQLPSSSSNNSGSNNNSSNINNSGIGAALAMHNSNHFKAPSTSSSMKHSTSNPYLHLGAPLTPPPQPVTAYDSLSNSPPLLPASAQQQRYSSSLQHSARPVPRGHNNSSSSNLSSNSNNYGQSQQNSGSNSAASGASIFSAFWK